MLLLEGDRGEGPGEGDGKSGGGAQGRRREWGLGEVAWGRRGERSGEEARRGRWKGSVAGLSLGLHDGPGGAAR